MENKIQYKKLHKDALKCKRIGMIIVGLIWILTFAVIWAVIHFIIGIELHSIIKILFAVIVAFIVLRCVFVPNIRYKIYKYYIGEDVIRVKSGIFAISEEIVPLERLHQISIFHGPIKRRFCLADVIVTTAGGNICIKSLKQDEAEDIAERLQKKINEIAIESRKSKNEKVL